MFDDATDLFHTVFIPAAPRVVWDCLVMPELLCQWVAMAPNVVSNIVADPVPGGAYLIAIRTPSGAIQAQEMCVLAAEPNQHLIVTDFLTAGYRPSNAPQKTVRFDLTPQQDGTLLSLTLMHSTPAARAAQSRLGSPDMNDNLLRQLAQLAQRHSHRPNNRQTA